MAEPSPPYTTEEMMSDTISKKDIVTFLQEKSSLQVFHDNLKVARVCVNNMCVAAQKGPWAIF